jgi:phage baseplate assembly protein W
MDNTPFSFRGTGWAFPVSFTKQGVCNVDVTSDIRDIEQSLTILLSTRPGERVMRPDFGCGLEDMLFEPANLSLITYIKDLIHKAILYHESRVDLENIDIRTDGGVLDGRIEVVVTLRVRSSNGRFNYVYDYYKREATIQPL